MDLCARCGTQSGGVFCPNCGAALGAAACVSCGAALPAGSRFCPACGHGIGAHRPAGPGAFKWVPLAVGGLAIVVLLMVLLRSELGTPQPVAEAAAPGSDGREPGTPPDLSTMNPRERFDRLYDRVMRASENGDQPTVDRFGPMALAAYGMLDQVDTDARYHAALLRLHSNDADGAKKLVDTMLATSKSHLFGYLASGMIARWKGDSAALKTAYREYLTRYDGEIAKKLDEYTAHKTMLERFLDDAKIALATPAGAALSGKARE